MRGLGIAIGLLVFLVPIAWHELGLSFPWAGRNVEFLEGPEVCEGELRVRGELQGEVVIGKGELLTFSIYGRDELRPGLGYTSGEVDPVLSFLEPAPHGQFYPRLTTDVQIAKHLKASPYETAFELVSDVPHHIASNPSDYELSIWGFSSPSEENAQVLRTAILRACP